MYRSRRAIRRRDGAISGFASAARGQWRGYEQHSEAKQLADQTTVLLYGKVVNAVFDDCFFVQEPSRAAGIRCVCAGAELAPGDLVNMTGTISTPIPRRSLPDAAYTKTGGGTRAQTAGHLRQDSQYRAAGPVRPKREALGQSDFRRDGILHHQGTDSPQSGAASGINVRARMR